MKSIDVESLMGYPTGVMTDRHMKPSDQGVLEYEKAIPALTVIAHGQEKNDLKNEMRRQLLLVAEFAPGEIEKVDLSKTPDEEFQKMARYPGNLGSVTIQWIDL